MEEKDDGSPAAGYDFSARYGNIYTSRQLPGRASTIPLGMHSLTLPAPM